MLNSPVSWAVLAMLAWGLWAVVADLATQTVSPTVAMVVSYLVGAGLALGYVFTQPESIEYTRDGLVTAGVAGVFAGLGAVAFYAGLARGSTSVVTTVSALYFVVAAAIGIAVLDEPVTVHRIAGIGFAVVAVVLLAR
ncbi:EamA family transporter [Haloarchaeobius sp. HME9146]|uniref:EamA family transporter n=1 Tax=Haloarchaeobius sp. HME9146 TaxID=2978732 RepID=UPI0021C213F8|nr:DMT family transporter [Haloarchaeobius sp. HME9146]MCT9095969.1 DMT family transporter [Haloarchaeobius sp. HME9146]